jgi:hypothetical protein
MHYKIHSTELQRGKEKLELESVAVVKLPNSTYLVQYAQSFVVFWEKRPDHLVVATMDRRNASYLEHPAVPEKSQPKQENESRYILSTAKDGIPQLAKGMQGVY